MFTREQQKEVAKNHGKEVAEALRQRLEKKEEEVKWFDRGERLSRRFHNFLQEDYKMFAEPRFRANGREYRGLLIVLDDVQKLVFVQVVEKEDRYVGSKQNHVIFSLFQNYDEIEEYAREVVEGLESEAVEG